MRGYLCHPALRHGITDLRGMLKRLAQIKKKKKIDEKGIALFSDDHHCI